MYNIHEIICYDCISDELTSLLLVEQHAMSLYSINVFFFLLNHTKPLTLWRPG